MFEPRKQRLLALIDGILPLINQMLKITDQDDEELDAAICDIDSALHELRAMVQKRRIADHKA